MIRTAVNSFRHLLTPYKPIDWVWKLMVLAMLSTLAALAGYRLAALPVPLPFVQFYLLILLVSSPTYLLGMNVAWRYNDLQQKLSRIALTDLLTGLDNRRAFFEKVEGRTGTILVMDVDRFKKVNDTFGHEVGDLALQEIARHLEGCVRVGDDVARFGGEEFAVLLEDIGPEQALEIGKRITKGVAVEPIGIVTLSVGGVVPQDWRGDLKVAMRRADLALYTAKHRGRACVVFWSPDVRLPEYDAGQGA